MWIGLNSHSRKRLRERHVGIRHFKCRRDVLDACPMFKMSAQFVICR